jgi:hypothetical protein
MADKKIWFRVLEDGHEIWRGAAYDTDHAWERCFWDEEPGSIPVYRLEKAGKVKISSTMTQPGWVKVWEGRFDKN